MVVAPLLDDLNLSELRQDYDDRGLDQLSDAALISAVAEVVARPRQPPSDSFVLHAPLELAARAAMLPLVSADSRRLARLHIVALAAQYELSAASDLPEPPANDPGSDIGPTGHDLLKAIGAGDLPTVDALAGSLAANCSGPQLAAELTDAVVPLTAAAAHAPIFLYHLVRLHPLSGVSPRLLRPLAQELAAEPEWRVRWFQDIPANGSADSTTSESADGTTSESADSQQLADALADTPLLGSPGSTFIHPLLMQVDESGVAAAHLGPVLGPYHRDSARTLLRVAAQSMLEDDPAHGPYGWSHCLTLPQAVLGLVGFSANPDDLLAMAATHVTAFRAGLGTTRLKAATSFDQLTDAAIAESTTGLASSAATSHDAHVVKYALACLDAAAFDPEARSLYHRAGHRLLDIWAESGGDPTDPLSG